MALECEISSPPLGGTDYKDTFKDDADIHRSENMDEGVGDPDLEEGEILDSGEEVNEESKEDLRKKKKRKKKKRKSASGSPGTNFESNHRSHASDKTKRKRHLVEDDENNKEEFLVSKKRHNKSHSSPRKKNKRDEARIKNDSQRYDDEIDVNDEDFFHSDDHFSDEYGDQVNNRKRPQKNTKLMNRKHMGFGPQKQPRKVIIESKIKRHICKFYLEGKCLKGDECTYRHDAVPPKKKELCKFYLNGFCRSGNACLFMHEQFPCKFFHTGVTCYSNENCRFSHDPLNEDSKIMLAKCLDSGKLPGDVDFREDQVVKKGSLLGSPPKIPRESRPDMFSKPNYYKDLNNDEEDDMYNDYGNFTPVNSDGQGDSWDTDKPMNVDEITIETDELNASSGERSDGNKEEDRSDANSKQSTQSVPSHLPKRQRELFMRIQQQQREAEVQEEGISKSDMNGEEDNWYSDDDDVEEGDQPLTAVLKKLQQQPEMENNKGETASNQTFDISSMINSIRNHSSGQISSDEGSDNKSKNKFRDPRLSKDLSKVRMNDSSPTSITKTAIRRTGDDYYLIDVSPSPPGEYNKYAILSQNNITLKNDPRIKKLIDKYGSIDNIIEEEKNKLPTLPDFVPPINYMGNVDMNSKKVLPNYSKGIDPRTGRRPPLLPPPPSMQETSIESNQPQPFQSNSPRPMMQQLGGFQGPCGQWANQSGNPQFMNKNFNNQNNAQLQNENRNINPAGINFNNQQGMQVPFQNKMNLNRDPRNKDPPPVRDPRTNRNELNDPRAVRNEIKDPRARRGEVHDPRTNRNNNTNVRLPMNNALEMGNFNMESENHDVNISASRDPRMQRGMAQQEGMNLPSNNQIYDPNVKNVFKTIDPTASPFC